MNSMKKFISGGVLISSVAPIFAFAAGTTLVTALGVVKAVLDLLIPIVITLAVVMFFFGLAQYILKAGEEKTKGRDIMIYGIITLFVMVAVWGLVQVIANTFNVNIGGSVNLPRVEY